MNKWGIMDLSAVLTSVPEGGYIAHNPETGTTTQGETVEKALANLREATELYLDELRPEYRREDFGIMVRGKHVQQLKEATNIVLLDPDVAEAFPNAEAVNQTLRRLLELAKTSVHPVSA